MVTYQGWPLMALCANPGGNSKTITMKNLIFFIALMGLTYYLFGYMLKDMDVTASAINFETGNWQEVQAKAIEEGKPIFVHIYATWCGPCKKMMANVYTDTELATYMNANFVNVAYDGEKGPGKQLAEKYKIKGYPSLLFFKPDGSITEHAYGYHNADELIKKGNKLLH